MTTDTGFARAAAVLQLPMRVVWLTGAGLSVASGIAPYRKSNDAVWAHFVTEWGTKQRLLADPHAWWTEFWLKAHGFAEAKLPPQPNAGHDAIAAFVARGAGLHHVITQNIDGLHRQSGVPEPDLVEIHGRADRFVCTNLRCAGAATPVDAVDYSVLANGEVPRCAQCQSPLRPLVLLFDETYDSHPAYRMRDARAWLEQAQVVVFVGTSFSVGITEFAVHTAHANGAVCINVNIDALDGFINVTGPSEQTLPALLAAALHP